MPHAFHMHSCACFKCSEENSWWNLISYVFSRVDLDLCLWNTEISHFPCILSTKLALGRRAILYVFYQGNCDFRCLLYNWALSLEPWFWISCISWWVFGTFRLDWIKNLWTTLQTAPQKWSFCLGRIPGFGSNLAQRPRDAPASPTPP